MFKRETVPVGDVVRRYLRLQGLETPLLQRRLIAAWPEVAGPVVARYTLSLRIFNQTLFVALSSPALRSELSMQRQELVGKLNEKVEAQIISDIRFQ